MNRFTSKCTSRTCQESPIYSATFSGLLTSDYYKSEKLNGVYHYANSEKKSEKKIRKKKIILSSKDTMLVFEGTRTHNYLSQSI